MSRRSRSPRRRSRSDSRGRDSFGREKERRSPRRSRSRSPDRHDRRDRRERSREREHERTDDKKLDISVSTGDEAFRRRVAMTQQAQKAANTVAADIGRDRDRDRDRDRNGDRDRGRDRDRDRDRGRVDEMPTLFKIYDGKVVRIEQFGAFVELDGVLFACVLSSCCSLFVHCCFVRFSSPWSHSRVSFIVDNATAECAGCGAAR